MFAPTPAAPLVAFALLSAGCASSPVSSGPAIPGPDVDVHERTVHYDVTGATVAELTAALDGAAPRIGGRPYRGTTNWNVRWRFRHASDETGCRITDVDVDLHVTTTVPRWAPPPGADPELARRWGFYRAALDVHESGHHDLAVAAATEVSDALRGLRAPSCDVLLDDADARGHEVVERYRDAQWRYDRETGHGRTQGAGWPPDRAGGDAIHAGSPER